MKTSLSDSSNESDRNLVGVEGLVSGNERKARLKLFNLPVRDRGQKRDVQKPRSAEA